MGKMSAGTRSLGSGKIAKAGAATGVRLAGRVAILLMLASLGLGAPPISLASAGRSAPAPAPDQTPRPTSTTSDPTDTSYHHGVLVIDYFPLTPDRQNIDINVTGDVSGTYAEVKANVIAMTNDLPYLLADGTKYRGFENPAAQPAITYSVVKTIERDTAVPSVPSTFNPNYPNRADYPAIFRNINICDFVVNQGVQDVWIWAYQGPHQLDISESKMSGPFGDISNSYRLNDLPQCGHTYRVYTFNYGRDVALAFHDYGHQFEAELSYFDNHLFRDLFEGPNYPATLGVTGRCGSDHNPPNARFEYDWANPTPNASDCNAWDPNGLGPTTQISCAQWACVDLGNDDPQRDWLVWWMQHFPGRGNTLLYQGFKMRNWWDVYGDFDALASQSALLTLPPLLSVSGVPSPTVAGVAHTLSIAAVNPGYGTSGAYRGTIHFTSSDPAAILPADYTFTSSDAGVHSFSVTLETTGTQSISATDKSTAATTGSETGIAVIDVPGKPTNVTAVPGSGSATVSWRAAPANGSLITGYVATSNPDSRTCTTTGALSCTVAGLTNGRVYTFTVKARNAVGFGPASAPSAAVLPGRPSTFHPVTPVRLLDTRVGNGHSGKLVAGTPMTFHVTGRTDASPLIPTGASALTGNLTVVGSSGSWAVYLGPAPIALPTSSTINFSAGEVIANGVTVALSSSGTLSATYMGPAGATTDLVFDVTGFFTPDGSGDTYHPMTPVRELDTRVGNGLSGKLHANTPICFAIAGRNGVPVGATAVSGNVTVTGSSAAWAVYVGPALTVNPGTSVVNFTAGQVASNNLTAALDSFGELCATFMGPAGATTDLVFDVTGFYTADASGASFVPLTPARLLDTRAGNGLSGKFTAGVPRSFVVAGRGGVPAAASAVTGNLTIVNESSAWAVYLGPAPLSAPTTSTLNFVRGDIKANGVTVALSAGGSLSATYLGPTGATTDLVFDVTGYFVK